MSTVDGRDTSDSWQRVLRVLGETDQDFDHVPPGGSHGVVDARKFLRRLEPTVLAHRAYTGRGAGCGTHRSGA